MPSVIDGDGSHQFFKGIDRPEPLADRLESTQKQFYCPDVRQIDLIEHVDHLAITIDDPGGAF